MNTEFYKHQAFGPLDDDRYSLNAEEVANIITQWIVSPPQYIPWEMVICPPVFQLKRK